MIKETKQALRKQMAGQRDQLPRKERNRYSEHISKQVWDYIIEKDVRVLHTFLTMGSEVNVLPLVKKALDHGLTVVAPKTLKKRQLENLIVSDLKKMEPGVFGTYHPKDAEIYSGSYDLILVAGLAFDKEGYRLGYGGGYYDTFLAQQPTAWKIGLAFPFQMIDSVPTEAHDVKLDQVIY